MNPGSKYRLVGSVIFGMLLALFVIWYASEQKNSHYGPSKIRVTHQGDIWILSDGILHVLNSEGAIQRIIRLDSWNRSSLLSDFFPLSNGDLLLAEPDTHEIYRCHLGAACKPLLASSRAAIGETKNAMMLSVDEGKQRIFVADNAGHRLLLLNLDGQLLGDTGQPRARFWYPNQIELQGDALLVVDTNHRRIVRVPVVGDRFGEARWELHTAAAKVRPGRRWPMSFLVLPDGQWWVAIAQEGMRRADVARFNATGLPIGDVALENTADPVSMALVGDRVLVADNEHYRVRQFDLQGNPLPDFGSAVFREYLARLAQRAGLWQMIRIAAQACVIGLPLLATLVLWRMGERPTTVPAALSFQREPAPIAADVVQWFNPTPRFIQQQTWFLRIFMMLTILMTGWAVWLGANLIRSFPLGGGMLAVMLMSAVFLMFLTWMLSGKLLRSKLGTDGIQLFHDKGDGKVYAYPLAQTLSDGNRLLAGQRMIVMRVMHRMIFDRDDLEKYILARLGTVAQRSPWQLYVVGMRNGNRIIWWNSVLIALALLIWAVARLTQFSLKPFLMKWLS